MKSLLIFSCLLALSLAITSSEWESFKTKFNKKYTNPTEEAFRKKIFLNNKMAIDQHNQLFDEGQSTFTMAINQFADLTTREVSEMLGPKVTPRQPSKESFQGSVSKGVGAAAFDWRDQGAVTPVKNQFAQGTECFSGWAFSATGSVESIQQIMAGKLVPLSEQNLIDCSKGQHNTGCEGGLPDNSFDYIISNRGIDTEESYQYEGKDGPTCLYTAANSGATITSYEDVPTKSEDDLLKAVTQQPVSAMIDANHPEFVAYSGGVYYNADCSKTEVNHGVLVVGYGDEAGEEFWIVKNSFGSAWGEEGYIRMSRNRQNNCLIASQASYPIY